MLIKKIAKLSAAGMLAVALAACSADGDSDKNTNTNTTNNPSNQSADEVCDSIELKGSLGGTQGLLCRALDDTALSPANIIVESLLIGSPLEDIVVQLDTLLSQNGGLAAVDKLLQQLLLANDSTLTPVVSGLNAVLVALLAGQDPTEIVNLLTSLGDEVGFSDPTGGELLGLLGAGENPITSLLAVLTDNFGGTDPVLGLLTGLSGELNGDTNPGGTDGLITVLQDQVLTDLLADTELAVLNDLLGELIDPATGVLAPLTGALDEATPGLLSGLVAQVNNGVLVPVGDGLKPVLDAVGGILGGLPGV